MDPSVEFLVAIAATVVALAALIVSVWQGIETRRHNRLSVIPKICSDELRYRGGEMALKLSNHGTGPAIIKKFQVYVDGAEMPLKPFGGWKDAFLLLGLNEPWVHYYFFAPGDAFRVGEEKSLVYIRPEDLTDERRHAFVKALERTNVVIEYESIYGDSFYVEANSRSSSDA